MSTKVIITCFLISAMAVGPVFAQHLYKTTRAEIIFFSSAPIEDIKAVSQKGISVLNSKTGEIVFQVNTRTFQFPKGLMQEHFNENFMESATYPTASFKGKITTPIDLSKQGEFSVVLQGILSVHGEEQKRRIPATLQVQGNTINLKSNFKVACKDHNIKIPRILWQNIAEVVLVSVDVIYSKLKS